MPSFTEHIAMDVVTVSALLEVVAAFVVTSLTLGSAIGVALGSMIRRADRRHRQEVALLVRARTLRGGPVVPQPRVGSERTRRGADTVLAHVSRPDEGLVFSTRSGPKSRSCTARRRS